MRKILFAILLASSTIVLAQEAGADDMSYADSAEAITVPEGIRQAYIYNGIESVSGLGSKEYPRYHVSADVYIDGSDVYIPVVFGSRYKVDKSVTYYLKGKLNTDRTQIAVPGGQHALTANGGTGGDVTFLAYAVRADNKSADPKKELVFNCSKSGVMMLDSQTTVGLFFDDDLSTPWAYFHTTNYTPDSLYAPEQKWAYTCTANERNMMTGKVEERSIDTTLSVIPNGPGAYYIQGLLAAYPDSWIYTEQADDGSLKFRSAVIKDNFLFGVSMGDNIYLNGAFTYDSDRTFKLDPVFSLTDVFYQDGVYTTAQYNRCVLTKPASAGIGNTASPAYERIASTEFYSISGQRVSSLYRGIAIRVTRYSDGKTKAEKITIR